MIIYYGVVITAVAFILWFQGVTQVSGSTAAIFTGVAPISAVVLSYVILQEPFQWAHVWGGLCVLVGIGFIVKPGSLLSVFKLAGAHFHKTVKPCF